MSRICRSTIALAKFAGLDRTRPGVEALIFVLPVFALLVLGCGRDEARAGAAGPSPDSVATALEAEMAKFPERYAEEPFPTIGVGDVRDLIDRGVGVVLVDAREPEAFAREHLPGAVNYPYGNWLEEGEELPPRDRDLVVYCNSQDCPISRLWSEQAAQRGYTRVRHLKAGIAGWKEAGFAIETGSP